MSISLDPEKTLKLVRYDYLNRTVVPGQILFAGSSLMEQFPVHEFQLGAGLSSLIYNRGISRNVGTYGNLRLCTPTRPDFP